MTSRRMALLSNKKRPVSASSCFNTFISEGGISRDLFCEQREQECPQPLRDRHDYSPPRFVASRTTTSSPAGDVQQSASQPPPLLSPSSDDCEFDVFGKHVSTQLRKMTLRQALIAENEINNILTKCRLADLHSNRSSQTTVSGQTFLCEAQQSWDAMHENCIGVTSCVDGMQD